MRRGSDWRTTLVLGVAAVAFTCLLLLVFTPSVRRTDAAPADPESPGVGDLPGSGGPRPDPGPPDAEPERNGHLLVARTPDGPSLRGTLLNAREEPIAGAWVKIVPVSSEPAFAQCVLTDEEGGFEFGRVPPHRYRVVVEGGGGYVIGLVAGEVDLERAGAYTDIHLPDTLLAGRVHTGGAMVENLHDPEAIRIELRSGRRVVARTGVEADLTFRFRGVEPGRYRLSARGFGFRDFDEELWIRGPREEAEVPVEPLPPTEVRVRVLTETGEPVTSGGVALAREGWAGLVWLRGDPTDPGLFVNGAVLPGEWRMSVRVPGFRHLSKEVMITEGRCSGIEVRLERRRPR